MLNLFAPHVYTLVMDNTGRNAGNAAFGPPVATRGAKLAALLSRRRGSKCVEKVETFSGEIRLLAYLI